MKAALLAAFLALPLRAQSPQPSDEADVVSPLTRFDAVFREANERLETVNKCLGMVAALKTDLAKKEKELRSEFGDPIPDSFNPLLAMKLSRIQKQEANCIKAYNVTGPSFDVAQSMLASVEPKNDPGIKTRRQTLEAQRDKLNAMAVKFGGQPPPKVRKADPNPPRKNQP